MSLFASMPEEPLRGWINAIRTTLRMSYRQLGFRLGLSPQQTRRIEMQEQDGSITLETLQSLASSLNLRFVYGFATKEGSLMDVIDRQVLSVANKLVKKGDQNNEEQVEQATQALVEKMKEDMPRSFVHK